MGWSSERKRTGLNRNWGNSGENTFKNFFFVCVCVPVNDKNVSVKVSGGGIGQWWPTTGLGELRDAVPALEHFEGDPRG